MSSLAILQCILSVLASAATVVLSMPAPRLGNIWSDEMALQHGLPFNVSGFAHPSSTLLPFIDKAPAGSAAICGADGIFNVEFAAQVVTSRDLKLQQGHVSLGSMLSVLWLKAVRYHDSRGLSFRFCPSATSPTRLIALQLKMWYLGTCSCVVAKAIWPTACPRLLLNLMTGESSCGMELYKRIRWICFRTHTCRGRTKNCLEFVW